MDNKQKLDWLSVNGTLSVKYIKANDTQLYDHIRSIQKQHQFKSLRAVLQHISRFGTYEPTKVCEECGAGFTSTMLSGFCSLACRNKNISQKPAARRKMSESNINREKNMSIEDKMLRSQKLIERWSKVGPEGKKIWSDKMLSTMGEAGIIRRCKEATFTKLKRGLIVGIRDCSSERKLYRRYYNRVTRLTKKIYPIITEGYIMGKHTNHLDHIFPISKGFKYGIPPELIGARDNLRVVTATENKSKSANITEIPVHIMIYIKENEIVIEN